MLKIVLGVLLVSCLQACAPVFSDLQSAKLVGKNKLEITPHGSSVTLSGNGESGHFSKQYGIQVGYGLSQNLDFRFRYETVHINFDPGIEDSDFLSSDPIVYDFNFFLFGPKYAIFKDRLTLYVPIGFATGEDLSTSETWEFHPTLLFTHQIGKKTELNTSIKALMPLKSNRDMFVAFNFGLGRYLMPDKWILRPEIGFLRNPGEEGYFTHASIGITYYP